MLSSGLLRLGAAAAAAVSAGDWEILLAFLVVVAVASGSVLASFVLLKLTIRGLYEILLPLAVSVAVLALGYLAALAFLRARETLAAGPTSWGRGQKGAPEWL